MAARPDRLREKPALDAAMREAVARQSADRYNRRMSSPVELAELASRTNLIWGLLPCTGSSQLVGDVGLDSHWPVELASRT
jgi:hypothetical protein